MNIIIDFSAPILAVYYDDVLQAYVADYGDWCVLL